MMRRLFSALIAVSLLAACGGGGDGTTPPVSNPAITLTASSTSGSVARGASATTTLTLARVDGYAGAVALTAEGVPAGVTVQFAPASLTGTTLSSTATISVAANAAPGAVSLTFRAAGAGVTDKTVQYALTVPAPGITLTTGAATVSAVQGATATVPVTITRTNGAAGAVTLTAEGLPANVTAAFAPTPIPDGQTTSTLTLTVGANAAAATSTVTIRAALAGATEQTTTVQLTVTSAATPGYTMTATPAAVAVTAGQSVQSVLAIARTGGFAGNVALTLEGAPAGVTGTFAPNPATAATSTLSIATTAAAVPGTYNLTVRGVADGQTDRTIVVALTVNSPPAITLTLAPTAVTIAQGASAQVAATLARLGGLTGDITLSATGAPAGMTVSFAPATVPGTASTITVAVGGAVAVGAHTVNLTATGAGNVTVSSPLAVTVAAPAGFTLAATNATVVQGATGASTITITRTGAFAAAVDLTVANLPANVTAAFNPASAAGTTSTLTFTAAAGAAPGTYTVTVNGVGAGAANQSTTLSLTVSASGGGGANFSWQFCDATRVPLWFAFRDGTDGAWTRVTATGGNTFTFTMNQAVGGVAYVVNDGGDTNTEVYYGTRAELQASLALECSTNPAAGKSLSGSVAGLTLPTQTASIFHGGAQGDASFAAPTYQLQNVATGNQELFGIRQTTTIGPPPSSSLDRMFLQRNVNVASGGTLPVVDFGGASSFAPATANITIANAGADQLFLTHVVRFANGTEANYVPDLFASGTTRTFYGIPTAQLAPGDLHAALAIASSSNNAVTPPTQDQRLLYSYFRTVADRTLTLGPTLAAVTLSSSTSGGLARPKAKANFQTEYGDAFGVTFTQSNGDRVVTISASRGYFGGGSEFELETPNFAGIDGFNNAWGLLAGASTEARVSAIGGLSGIINQPADGTAWRVAARSTTFTP